MENQHGIMEKHLDQLNKEKLSAVLALKRAYLAGEIDLASAQAKLSESVKVLAPYEIAWIEQELQAYKEDECQTEDIQAVLSLFAPVLQKTTQLDSLAPNHPLSNYRRENSFVLEILEKMQALAASSQTASETAFPLADWQQYYRYLMEYRYHFKRKQNQLYAALEQKGFDRPSTTMWTYDDYIWAEIKKAKALLEQQAYQAFLETHTELAADLKDLIEKEENILYPTAYKLLSTADFQHMHLGDNEIGYANISMEETVDSKAPAEELEQTSTENTVNASSAANAFASDLQTLLAKYHFNSKADLLEVSNGNLSLEQLNLIFQHLPVDISFVDENEIVRFYNDSKERIFPRSRNVIGRNVKNCHPPKSVHIVEEIFTKFLKGEENFVDFWLDKGDVFIYISYTAVRDAQGNFRGVLEMMQDCTRIRQLQGSRTLLTFEKSLSESIKESLVVDSPLEAGKSQSDTAFAAEAINTSKDAENKEAANNEATLKQQVSSPAAPLEELELNATTKLKDLLALRPSLRTELANINPKFKLLNSKLAKLMLPDVNLKMMAERSGMELSDLIAALKHLFAN